MVRCYYLIIVLIFAWLLCWCPVRLTGKYYSASRVLILVLWKNESLIFLLHNCKGL